MMGAGIIAVGQWRPGQVRVKFDPEEHIGRDPKVEALIEEAWAQAQSRGGLLFPGPLYRLAAYDELDHRLLLTVGPTDYREYLGTNRRRHDVERVMGDFEGYLANPLAVCSVVRTSDQRLVFGRRGPDVENAGKWHVIGGHVDREGDGENIDVFHAMEKELCEEMGLEPAKIVDMVCLGLAAALDTAKPELLFASKVAVTHQEVVKDREHTEFAFVPDRYESLREFTRARRDEWVGIGRACLEVYSHGRFGRPLWGE